MGKQITSQKRGRGSPRYRAPSHNYKAMVLHKPYTEQEKNNVIYGKVIDFVHCPGHSAPLAKIKFEDNTSYLYLAAEGISTNQTIASGALAPAEVGNTLPLKNIPIGSRIFNIELKPGDGGRLIRAAGSSATLISKTDDKVVIELPSKKRKEFNINCRATMGILSASGKKEKPFLKAGKKHFAKKARNKLYPVTSGVAMNAVDHPFGSGRGRHVGKPKTPSRFAPPGQKVGLIRARRTGKKR